MKPLLVLLFLTGACSVRAQSLAVTYDLSTKHVISGLSFAPAPILHDLFGLKGLNATPMILGGIDQFGLGAVGGELAFSVPVAREIAATLGVGGVAIQGSKSHLLVSFGIQRRF